MFISITCRRMSVLCKSLFFMVGIEDKLVATDKCAIVVMDEASSFFQEIKEQDESNIGLLNQLFDRRGDKLSFANIQEHFIPTNSMSMSLGVQLQPFFPALSAVGTIVWMDSGFAEHFLFTIVKPFK